MWITHVNTYLYTSNSSRWHSPALSDTRSLLPAHLDVRPTPAGWPGVCRSGRPPPSARGLWGPAGRAPPEAQTETPAEPPGLPSEGQTGRVRCIKMGSKESIGGAVRALSRKLGQMNLHFEILTLGADDCQLILIWNWLSGKMWLLPAWNGYRN